MLDVLTQQGLEVSSSQEKVLKRKPTRTPSRVWVYFDRVNDDAFCKYCHKSYKTNSSKHGTTNLTKHVRDCQKRKQEIIALGKGFKGDTNVVTMKLFKFNQDCTHITLAKIIIMNELSFQFVENERFKNFIQIFNYR